LEDQLEKEKAMRDAREGGDPPMNTTTASISGPAPPDPNLSTSPLHGASATTNMTGQNVAFNIFFSFIRYKHHSAEISSAKETEEKVLKDFLHLYIRAQPFVWSNNLSFILHYSESPCIWHLCWGKK
jgi:hypothetical protein